MAFSIASKWPGKCPFCGKSYPAGTLLTKRDGKWGHKSCTTQETRPVMARRAPGGDFGGREYRQPRPVEIPVGVALKTAELPSVLESKPDDFQSSRFQSAIFDAISAGTGNIVVVATAGGGKTATLKHSQPYLPKGSKIAAIAFNKRNAADLQKALPEARASTFHSLGLKNVKNHFPEIIVDTDKTWKKMNEITNQDSDYREVVESDGSAIRQMVDLARATLCSQEYDSLLAMAEHYGITLEVPEGAIKVAQRALKLSNEDHATADFSDMLYWAVNGTVPTEKFDFVLQDEAQDAPQVQIEFIKKIMADGARLLSVGDPRQSLYQFSGAAIDSMEQLTRYHHATNMPLSITYRLPLSHVEHIHNKFPGIDMEARPNAPDGELLTITDSEMLRTVSDGDLVICRMNAPLVKPAFELIRQGRKAVILGRDIGKGLGVLLRKIQKRHKGSDLVQVIIGLQDYAAREMVKLLAAKKFNQADTLQDQVDTIIALSDSCDTVQQVHDKIDSVFSDNSQGTIFSSIHKAKGGEADRVYLLRPDLIPSPMAKEEWQKVGEQNCLFVALSRSKHGLYFVPN